MTRPGSLLSPAPRKGRRETLGTRLNGLVGLFFSLFYAIREFEVFIPRMSPILRLPYCLSGQISLSPSLLALKVTPHI